jgi:MFS family permease
LGASYLFFALLPVSKNFLLALLLIGLSNLSFYVALVAIHSDVQQFTPNDMRGKVFASAPTIFVPIGLISILIASPLADRVGVEWVFLFSGMMALITLPWVGRLNQLSSQLLEPLLKPKAPADRDVNGVSKRF